jgi:hypothetical protein
MTDHRGVAPDAAVIRDGGPADLALAACSATGKGSPVNLSFSGDCEAVFTFYEECLDGKLGEIFRYAGTPLEEQVPADWENKVMPKDPRGFHYRCT